MVWKPHVTVAAIVEQNNRYLLVEEQTSSGIAYNQPAGHLDPGENLIDAVKRETLEETGWLFEPEYVVSLQLWRKAPDASTFLRVCFAGHCSDHDPGRELDVGIIAAHWLSRDEIIAKGKQLRSPLVLTSIDQYISGEKHSLSLLKSFLD